MYSLSEGRVGGGNSILRHFLCFSPYTGKTRFLESQMKPVSVKMSLLYGF